MKLYFAPGACSFVPHACLHQIRASTGTSFESQLVNLREGAQRSDQYLAVNPRAQVPALQIGNKVLTQVIAVCTYLHQSYPQARLFSEDIWLRAQQLSTLAWMNNTVHPTYTHVFRPEKFVADEPAKGLIQEFNKAQFRVLLAEINRMTETAAPFLFGADFSPADAYALAFFRWGGNIGVDPESLPAYFAYAQRLAEFSPVQQTMALEGIKLVTYVKAPAA